ncbi:MAG: tetratricopeptide repeat protein [Pseudomonadota bacterium]
MAESSDELERLSREQLILKARVLGVERAELMTRVEMRDEIVRRSEPDLAQQKRARGFLGVARDLVASVVEAGLNLPDAAAIIRGDSNRENQWKGPPPVATVTLAEIYAAQGHLDRALRMLDEVLAKEPDHDPARALRTRLATATDLPIAPPRRRQKVSFADNVNVPVEVDVLDLARDPEPDLASAPASAPVNVNVPEPASGPDPASASLPVPEPEPAPPSAIASDPTSVPVDVPAPDLLATSAPVDVPVPPPSPALLTLSLSGQRQIYWELPPQSLNPLRAHSPNGRPVVRVVSFRTRSGRVERHASDLNPDSEVGFAVLPDLRADAVVRAVLGWEADGRFMPYVVASDLSSGTPSTLRNGPFRASPLVGAVAHEVEQRALSYCSRRPAH